MGPYRVLLVMTLTVAGLPVAARCQQAASEAGQGSGFASSDEGLRFFESRIRPLLVEHCYACHGPDEQESALRVDSWSALQAGGGTGKLFVPGHPEQSLLIKAVRYEDTSLQMPPDGKLSDSQIADLERWVAAGAPHPDAVEGQAAAPREPADADLWSLQPIADVALPDVRDTAWPQSPIDYFVLARLEAAGLSPNEPADRLTLIRRVTYDLTGLPPSPAEIDAWLADNSPDAYERLVDRLLATPQYGERWGRHWLDVARYADSNGLDENIALGNAWRYRDWVVRSLNRDMPYDQFVVEQLAGDLLPSDDQAIRYDRLIATGFLSLGPKVLAEVDQTKMEMDIIDEQVDTLGRTLMGLTFGCARCHDHKFDPITAEDYYALAGIFKSTRTMENFKVIAKWYEHEIPTAEDRAARDAHQAKLGAKKSEIDTAVAAANAQLQAQLGAGAAMPEKPEEHYSEETKAQLKQLRDELAAIEKEAPEIPTAMGVSEGTITDLPIHLRGSHLSLGKVVPRSFPAVLTRGETIELPDDHSGRLELARWITRPDHPLTARVLVNRLWRWHFDRGLVASVDNFGRLGTLPTHPELLDWLARQLVRQGWSLKHMHRLLMLSSTYRMSSDPTGSGRATDPDNLLLWRAPLRRLEAEAIRDALLAVSGQLDLQMGGSLLHVKNREFFFDHTSKDTTSYDSRRRSLYLPVVRNNLYDGFQLFDYTDAGVPQGDRTSTVVPTQALMMLNGQVSQHAAEALALRLRETAVDEAERVKLLYRVALGRQPAADEVTGAQSALTQLTEIHAATTPDNAYEQAWITLCHALLASNEFIYLR